MSTYVGRCMLLPVVLLSMATACAAQPANTSDYQSVDTGTLVVVNKGDATATLIDLGNGKTLATLPTGNGPHEVAVSRDGRGAVVSNYGANSSGSTLTLIDVAALDVASTIPLGRYRRPGVSLIRVRCSPRARWPRHSSGAGPCRPRWRSALGTKLYLSGSIP